MSNALAFFKLYFTDELLGDIVRHTNSYAYIKFADENHRLRDYMESDGSWRDTTPEEILKLIALVSWSLGKIHPIQAAV